MKSFFIRALFTFIIILSVSIVSYLVYFYLYKEYDERLSCRINEEVIVINDILSSMYLLKTNEGYIAFDTGLNRSIIRRGLDYNKLIQQNIIAIFFTHLDFDHTGGLDLFTRADVYVPAAEKDMESSGTERLRFLPFYSNHIEKENTILVNERDVFMIGGRKIKCISLPGHTLGSTGYIVDDKYLFSGDAFRIKNGRIDVPYKKMFTMDLEEMKNSIKKAAAISNIKYILSAHSGFTSDIKFAFEKWK